MEIGSKNPLIKIALSVGNSKDGYMQLIKEIKKKLRLYTCSLYIYNKNGSYKLAYTDITDNVVLLERQQKAINFFESNKKETIVDKESDESFTIYQKLFKFNIEIVIVMNGIIDNQIIYNKKYLELLESLNIALRIVNDLNKIQCFHYKDNLTGLSNEIQLRKDLLNCLNNKEKYIFGLINVNELKTINENKGYDYGNKVLISVADIIKKYIKGGEAVYRFYGDMFAVILNENYEKSYGRLVELCSIIKTAGITVDDYVLYNGISIGLVELKYISSNLTVENIYSMAVSAQRAEKNSVTFSGERKQIETNSNLIFMMQVLEEKREVFSNTEQKRKDSKEENEKKVENMEPFDYITNFQNKI